MNESSLARKIAELGPWFHNLRIDGVETAPDHPLGDYPRFKWEGFRHAVPEDLTGASVLDIGCNAGFYAIEMARRGARWRSTATRNTSVRRGLRPNKRASLSNSIRWTSTTCSALASAST